MTDRVLRALRWPGFKIWGHPLGRLVPSRPPIPLRIEEVLDAVAESNSAIEINGDPVRMDLPPDIAASARERKVSFVLGVDAHSTGNLDFLRVAVALARRAGIRKGSDHDPWYEFSMDRIGPNARVVLDYTLKADGEIVDSSDDGDDREPIVYVHGYGMIVPGLEVALVGLRAGDTKAVTVKPEDGYGDRDEELVVEVDRSEMPRPSEVAVGDEIVAESPEGDEAALTVIDIDGNTVVLDGNHPLAGKTLHYAVIVRHVGPASDAEIEDAARAFEEARAAMEPEPDDLAENGLLQLRRSPKSLPN